MDESSKEQHLFEIEIFCNIINIFTVTFDQFNASFLNERSIPFRCHSDLHRVTMNGVRLEASHLQKK